MIPQGHAQHNLTVDWRDHRRCRRPVGLNIMARATSWQRRKRAMGVQALYRPEPWSPDRR